MRKWQEIGRDGCYETSRKDFSGLDVQTTVIVERDSPGLRMFIEQQVIQRILGFWTYKTYRIFRHYYCPIDEPMALADAALSAERLRLNRSDNVEDTIRRVCQGIDQARANQKVLGP